MTKIFSSVKSRIAAAALAAGLALAAAPAAAFAEGAPVDDSAADVAVEQSAEIALAQAPEESVTLWRMYNYYTGEHLYTTDWNEVVTIYADYGWGYEGVAWYAPTSGTPVYRLYNPDLNQHLYTTDTNETSVLTSQYAWQFDNDGNPLFYSGGGTPNYRLYSGTDSNLHLLTTDANERDALASQGWTYEGVGVEVVASSDSNVARTHFYPQGMFDGLCFDDQGNIRYYVGGVPQTGFVAGPISPEANGLFYLGDDGILRTGTFKVGGVTYTTDATGVIRTQLSFKMAGSWFKVQGDGSLRVANDLETAVGQACEESGYDLWNCFIWITEQDFEFVDGDTSRDLYGTDWAEEEAERQLIGGAGDCYSWAAAFCYMAQNLGYNATCVAGYNLDTDGTYGAHGWVEIDGLIYDPQAYVAYPEYNWFGVSYDTSAMVYYTYNPSA